MEDLWRVQNSGIDIDDIADSAEFKRLLDRFREIEEKDHRRNLLYREKRTKTPQTGENR